MNYNRPLIIEGGFFVLIKKGVEKMLEEVLILSCSSYDFNDQETGRNIKGNTVWLVPSYTSDENVNGIKPVKYTVSDEVAQDLNYVKLPANGTMKFAVDFTRNKVIPLKFENIKVLESL